MSSVSCSLGSLSRLAEASPTGEWKRLKCGSSAHTSYWVEVSEVR